LTQLAALGSQDQYLSVAGEITFFKGVYRRHTNFAKESVMMQFNQTPSWGSQTTCVISRTGDLLSKVWLNATLPPLNTPLKKEEFYNLKKALMGNTVKKLQSNGLPATEVGKVPFTEVWTVEQNESLYLPSRSKEGVYYTATLDVSNSIAKSSISSTTTWDSFDLASLFGADPVVDLKYLQEQFIIQRSIVGGNTSGPFVWDVGSLDEATFNNSLDLQREFIQRNPGKYPKARYCDEVGHAMIEKVDLVIGGTLIDSHPGHYLQVWNELTQTPEKKQIARLIGRSGSEAELEEWAMESQELYIPLQFFFCRHLMCSLPLIALQYHQVELKFTFKKLSEVVAFAGYKYHASDGLLKTPAASNLFIGHNASWYQHMSATQSDFVTARSKDELTNSSHELKAKLMCNLVYLEEEERKTFAGSTHEYLVDLLQFQGPQAATESTTTYHAYFNHPTSELIWTITPRVAIENGEPFNYTALQSAYNSSGDTLVRAKLQFNGYDRFGYFDASYFREIVPAQYHTSVPTRPVYVYSFALEPEDFRPSGSVNLSRIDNVKLILDHVNFNPPITVQPVIGSDAVNDYFASGYSERSEALPVSQSVAKREHRLSSDTSMVSSYIGATNGGNTITEKMLLQTIARQNHSTAVALHPDQAGNGLFLQQADGMATKIVPGADIHVYARSKNVLRIKSGMAGLAYAN
jgi:hypothetical protein